MPPSQALFDEPYVSAPADHAVYWHDYQTGTGTQQTPYPAIRLKKVRSIPR